MSLVFNNNQLENKVISMHWKNQGQILIKGALIKLWLKEMKSSKGIKETSHS